VTGLQDGLLVAWAVVGTMVVAVREPIRQAALVGIMGLLAALTFFTLKAPDVALSMLVVGGLALPLMILLAAARISSDADQEESGE
jgi:energy-converting hydrogenase B subunit D